MIQSAANLLKKAKRPLALAGAGLSAESGIPTFRDTGGLWKNFSFQDLASPQGFRKNPQLVWEWYAMRRDTVAACRPNPAHHALATLEKHTPEFWLLTQNVDGLSQRVGAQRVIELHGSLWRFRCNHCGQEFEDLEVPMRLDNTCAHCGTKALRPGVVWFGESLDRHHVEMARELVSKCDLFFVLGTSAQVFPAAGFIPMARQAGAEVIEINPDATPMSDHATVVVRAPVGEALPAILKAAGIS